MEEAVRCGSAQVILGDRPALVTQRRLAQGIWAALTPRAIVGLVAFNALVLGGSLEVLEPSAAYGALGVSLVATAATMLPVAAPFLEIWRFSTMSAEEIEATVAVKEPIDSNLDQPFKVWGEDALLQWPGASESVIAERDAYMARALAAAALGTSLQCGIVQLPSPVVRVFDLELVT
jgi:pheromone shutdown protein TraB